jgi:hypothetical protein
LTFIWFGFTQRLKALFNLHFFHPVECNTTDTLHPLQDQFRGVDDLYFPVMQEIIDLISSSGIACTENMISNN